MSSRFASMVQAANRQAAEKMKFGGIGDKLKEQQAAEKPVEKPAEKFVFNPTVGPLAALKNLNIPGRDGPAGKPSEPGDRPPRGERLRAARRRARRTGRRSLLSASRLRRADESGDRQRTLG